jgi:NADH-quinone oxidoreductase subunit N
MKAIIATTIFGIIMMFAGVTVKNKQTVAGLATFLFAALLGVSIWDLTATSANVSDNLFFNNMLRIEHYSVWFNTVMTGCSLIYVLLMGKEVQRVGAHVAEYFALLFFILCGLFLLSSYNTLLMMFLGLEILSIPQYILAGSDKKSLKSSEASLKYLLMGSFTTGIMLMGITLLYGAARSFNITEIAAVLHSDTLNPLALAGIMFIMIALSFKVSAAPMHMWTPDVYDGAPTPFTAYMSTIVKAGAFFAFLRLFQVSLNALSSHWTLVLAIITAATLLVGNVTAVFQQSVKRMLAYSSIAQAGFMLFAVLAVNKFAWQGIIIYSVAYSLATIGIFSVLVKLKDFTYDGFNGLAKSEPLLAFTATIFLFSLAGIPLTGGFMAKYYVLIAVVQQGQLLWLVIFALLMAAISIFYYFRVIIAMYFKPGTPEMASPLTTTDRAMLLVTCALVILLGVAPQLFLNGI